MSKISKTLFCSFLAFVIIVIGNYVIVAQTTLAGEWRAEAKADKPDKIYLSFSTRKTENRYRNQMGQTFEYADLKGLSRDAALSNGAVKFSLSREAGTIDCEGSFSNGKGSGTFVFTGNQSFLDAMKSRGFDFEKNDSKNKFDEGNNTVNRLFAATTINVTTALADDLLSSNFGNLDTGDLFKAAIFKVDGKFAREMKDSGFQNLTFDDLVKARIFKIDAEFVRDVAAKGFSNEPFESLVKMKIFKITPEFITEVRAEGFQNLEIEQLVKMKIFNINAEFIREARSEGVPMDIEKLVQKRIGVYRSKED